MQYQKFRPAEVLSPFVECYFTWDGMASPEELVIESPPSGFGSIVFNYGDDYFLQNKKYERLAVPRQFMGGQSIYSYKLFLTKNYHGNYCSTIPGRLPAAANGMARLPLHVRW